MLATSIEVQAASAARIDSVGLGPARSAPASSVSKLSSKPVPVRASTRSPPRGSSTVAIAVSVVGMS